MTDWDDMRIFLAVARTESLSGAGRLLRLDPATVGRRIARLEERLGTRLFARSPQGYALSDAGARVLTHAGAAETAMAQIPEALGGPSQGLSGQIRIGAPDGCANFVLPQVIAAICADNPGLEVQVVALPRVFNLSKREADMAIAVSAPQAGRLTVQKITDYHLHLAGARRYLDSHAALTDLQSLQGHRIVGYIPDMIFDRELDYLSELGVGAPQLASNSVPVQLQLIAAGAGLGIVHDFALPFAPGVVRVLADAIALTRAFYLIRHADDRGVARLNRFAAALGAGLRREVAQLESAVAASDA